jgi:hypothetical protein
MADDKARRALTVETIRLYHKIAKRLGDDEAKRMFGTLAKDGPSLVYLRSPHALNNQILLILYDALPSEIRSVPNLWRIVNHGKKRPIGPRGSQSLVAFEKHMTRLLAKRKR